MPPIHRPRETADLVRRAAGARPIATTDLAALGVSRQRIRTAISAGTLIRVRRGVVRAPAAATEVSEPAPPLDPRGPEARAHHSGLARAALLRLADDSVVSLGSAALLETLPTFARPPLDVWVTAPRHGRVVAGTHRRLGTVDPVDRMLVDGVVCTSVARTALDIARRRPLHESLVVLDAALARVGRRELRATMARLEWVYDLPLLSTALEAADALSESPLESMSRGWMLETGVRPPLLQQQIEVGHGRRYRVDFLWPEQKVIGEADGMSKYASIDDVRAEKLREDELRRAGYTVVRWTYQELMTDPMAVMLRIQRALAG